MTIDMAIDTMREHDREFVYDSWLRSYRNSPDVRGVPNGLYFARQRRIVDALIGHSDVRVARPASWPEGILGWACVEQFDDHTCVHYAFVKRAYRQHGVLRAILATYMPRESMVFSCFRPPYTDYLRDMGMAHAPEFGSRAGGKHVRTD